MPPLETHTLIRWACLGVAALSVVWAMLAISRSSTRAFLSRPSRLTVRRCPGRWRWRPFPWPPSCSYDLSGVPRSPDALTTCPECGLRNSESNLNKHPRRWRLAFLLLLPLQLALYAGWCTPRFEHEGVYALIPTTALALLVPAMDHADTTTTPIDTLAPAQRLFHSWERRARADEVHQWQWNLALDNCGAAIDRLVLNPPDAPTAIVLDAVERGRMSASRHRNRFWADVAVDVTTRPDWPAGENVHAAFHPSLGRASGYPRVLITLPDGSEFRIDALQTRLAAVTFQRAAANLRLGGMQPLQPLSNLGSQPFHSINLGPIERVLRNPNFRVRIEYLATPPGGRSRWVLAREWSQPLPIALTPPESTPLPTFSSEDFTTCLRTQQPPVLHQTELGWRNTGEIPLDFSSINVPEALSHLHGATAGARLEVLRDGVCVGVGEHWWRSVESIDWRATATWVRIASKSPDIEAREPADWTLRIIGDPGVALRDPNATAAWVGEVTIPLAVQDRMTNRSPEPPPRPRPPEPASPR